MNQKEESIVNKADEILKDTDNIGNTIDDKLETKRDTSFTSYKNKLKQEGKNSFNLFEKLSLERKEEAKEGLELKREVIEQVEEIKQSEEIIDIDQEEIKEERRDEEVTEKKQSVLDEEFSEQEKTINEDKKDDENRKESQTEEERSKRDTSFGGYKKAKSGANKEAAREYTIKLSQIAKLIVVVAAWLMVGIPVGGGILVALYVMSVGLLIGGVVTLGVSAFFVVTEIGVLSQMMLFLATGLLSGGGLSVLLAIVATKKSIWLAKYSIKYIDMKGEKAQ